MVLSPLFLNAGDECEFINLKWENNKFGFIRHHYFFTVVEFT